jgi:hypothetical protein
MRASLGGCGHREAGQSRGAEASQADHEEIWTSSQHHRWTSGIFGGDERYRCCSQAAQGWWPPQQSRGEFASAVSPTRTGDAAVSESEDTAEVQLNSRPGPQSIQSGAPSRHEASLQAETSAALAEWRALACGIERRLRADVSPYVSAKAVTLTTPWRGLFDRVDGPRRRNGHQEVIVGNSAILRTSRMMLATRTDSPWLSDVSAEAGTGPSALALARISARVRADRASSSRLLKKYPASL